MKTKRKIYIETSFIKLDQFLKYAGVCGTGGEAKQRIIQGEVLVNGEICIQRGKKVFPGDTITFFQIEFEVLQK